MKSVAKVFGGAFVTVFSSAMFALLLQKARDDQDGWIVMCSVFSFLFAAGLTTLLAGLGVVPAEQRQPA